MKIIILISALLATSLTSYAQTKQPTSKYGALAIDRSNGFYYGWSFDYPTLAEAEKKAIEECNTKGGNCTVVLSYSGTGCAAYRTVESKTGTAFGWGLAKTKEEADVIATKECMKRSNGISPENFVWSCNSANTGTLKEIYNASGEIVAPIQIGTQIWMNRNLDVSVFRNGDVILQATTQEDWKRLSDDEQKPAWCYYAFDPENGKKYGKLYNWFAVNDARGLAPSGWHIPSKDEFNILINFAGGDKVAGPKLRSKYGWTNKKNGTDDFGFNLLPGGYMGVYGIHDNKMYGNIGENTQLWTSSNQSQYNAHNVKENEIYFYVSDYSKKEGYSVRLIKDQ
jgi:uncharacterized protein (TIGR02145 family)